MFEQQQYDVKLKMALMLVRSKAISICDMIMTNRNYENIIISSQLRYVFSYFNVDYTKKTFNLLIFFRFWLSKY